MAQSRDGWDEFLETPLVTEGQVLSTKIPLVPPCEAKGTVTGLSSSRRPPNERNPEWSATVTVTFVFNDPEIKESTGLDEPKALHYIRLDTVKGWDGDGPIPLDWGRNSKGENTKNIGLSRYLAAFHMNDGKGHSIAQTMHEEAWCRVVAPFNDQSAYATVDAVGVDKESVTRGARR